MSEDIGITLARIEERLINLVDDNKRDHNKMEEHLRALNSKTEKNMVEIALQKQFNALQEEKLVSHDKKINQLILSNPQAVSVKDQLKQPTILSGLAAGAVAVVMALKQMGLM